MILPYLQTDNTRFGRQGSHKHLIERASEAYKIARVKGSEVTNATSMYDYFEDPDTLREKGFSESELSMVANWRGIEAKIRVDTSSRKCWKLVNDPSTLLKLSESFSKDAQTESARGMNQASSGFKAELTDLVEDDSDIYTDSRKPRISSVEPIQARWMYGRDISPNNFFYESAKHNGRARWMSEFLDDDSVDEAYKVEMKNKYGWLKRFDEEPWTRDKLGSNNVSVKRKMGEEE